MNLSPQVFIPSTFNAGPHLKGKARGYRGPNLKYTPMPSAERKAAAKEAQTQTRQRIRNREFRIAFQYVSQKYDMLRKQRRKVAREQAKRDWRTAV